MTEVISVRFRNGCKNYDFDPCGEQVKMGDQVIVETAQGTEFATCTRGNHEVPDEQINQPLCSMLRRATEADLRTVDYNRKRESEAFDICEKKIADHGLEMKLVNVSASFDGNKIVFYFTADGRVDFRELVRDLASVFRARIELRQIGVRDEAKMVGGLGICGRPFCCSQFLDGFMPVSIKMAKTQSLSLNPTKISGTCGRLMCCLKYEQNAYEDAVSRMPKQESFVQTPDGPGNVKSVDLLQETVKVSLDSSPEPHKTYRNCEVRVLRNGKGSREGIEIPERTERYTPGKEEIMPEPSFRDMGFAEEKLPAEEPHREEKAERRSRPPRHRENRENRENREGRESRENRHPREERSGNTKKENREPKTGKPQNEQMPRSGKPQEEGSHGRSRKPFAPRGPKPQREQKNGGHAEHREPKETAAEAGGNDPEKANRKPRPFRRHFRHGKGGNGAGGNAGE